jgi:hypothetical protein
MEDFDIRLAHDYKWMRCVHLQGREQIVTIVAVEKGEVEGENGRKSKKPVLKFKEHPLPFAISKTDTKTLTALYGPKASGLVGKRIAIYPTTTKLGNSTVECIRIRPRNPDGAGNE